jgi:peptidoglycan/xylan/chitin deacetylase (PgdA/CDA1 family)
LPTPDGTSRTVRLPILMYHYLSEPPVGSDRYRLDLSVAPDLFEQHLAYLQAEGYEPVSLYDLLYHLALGWALPEKPVIITFDDGYRDNYENAFPLLRRYGFIATFFVVTELASLQDNASYMTWDQLREMAAAGMDVECHARLHEDLTQNDGDRLVWQVLGCREQMEAELGRRPRFIAYPGGRYDDRVIALFASDHFWGGITTQQGIEHDSDGLFEIKRLRVRGTTSVAELAELLAWQGDD